MLVPAFKQIRMRSRAGRKERQLTLFRVALAHALVAAASALDRAQDAVHVGGTTPFLVCEDVDAELFFAGLDQPHVGKHAFVLEGTGKLRGNGCIGVEAGKRNELEDEAISRSSV